jgi:hypothetical protein
MPETNSNGLASLVRQAAHSLTGAADDYDPLLDLIGEARYVLLGEATHGTHEFYRERAQITKRLVKEKGFRAVVVEADWPDAYRVNRYVRGFAENEEGVDALEGFKRFPTWMWRNADVLDFIGWLRAHNEALSANAPKVGFYGLDLYSLHTSIEAVLGLPRQGGPGGGETGALPLWVLRALQRGHPRLRPCGRLWPDRVVRGRRGQPARRAEAARRGLHPPRWARGRR